MTQINLLAETANGKSVEQNSANLTNMYLTMDSDNGKYQANAYPTPGLTIFATLPTSPVRAMYDLHGVLYVVSGNTLYSVNSSGTPTSIGTLNTTTGFAKMRGINQQLMIIDGTNGFIYNIVSHVFSQITDTNFTQNCTDLNSQDEIFMVVEPNSQTWQICQISDGTDWTFEGLPLFTSVTGNNNYLAAIISLQRQVWLPGTTTTSVYYNAGQAGFTFAQNASVFTELGCAAPQSLAYGDNTLFMLAKDRNGGIVVVNFNGYTPAVISTSAINYQLSLLTTISDAIGFTYWQEGHEFYVLSFPTANKTFVYDMAIQAWHQRTSLLSGIQGRWLVQSYCFSYNMCLGGDFQSGNIYKLDMTNFTENGTAITRTLVTNPYYQAGAMIFVSKLQIDFDENAIYNSGGTANTTALNLYVSRDGGRTYGAAKPQSLVGSGLTPYGYRVQWQRLGASRNFTYMLQTSMNAQFIILGAWATVVAGTA